MEAIHVQMVHLYLIFQVFKGRSHGNQIMLQKCYQCQLISLAFVALALENELQYHGLAVCINSANDTSVLCANFVKLKLILRAFFARSPGGSSVIFCYYLLGGDTARRVGYMLGSATHF